MFFVSRTRRAVLRFFFLSSLVHSNSLDAFRALNKALDVNCSCVTVKYLREVTPYFRKASIIQEVGWELQRGFLSATPPPPKSPPRADTRYLPLQLCRLTRAHHSSDPGEWSRQKLWNFIQFIFVIDCTNRWKFIYGYSLKNTLSNRSSIFLGKKKEKYLFRNKLSQSRFSSQTMRQFFTLNWD